MGEMRAGAIQMLCIVIGKNRAGLSEYYGVGGGGEEGNGSLGG